jgi:hypothetical protein
MGKFAASRVLFLDISILTLEGDQYCLVILQEAIGSFGNQVPTCEEVNEAVTILGCCAGLISYLGDTDVIAVFEMCNISLPTTICPGPSKTLTVEAQLTFTIPYPWSEQAGPYLIQGVQSDISAFLGDLPSDVNVTGITSAADGAYTTVTISLQGKDDAQTRLYQTALEQALNTLPFIISVTQAFFSETFYHNQIALININVTSSGAPTTTTGSSTSPAVTTVISFAVTIAALLFAML